MFYKQIIIEEYTICCCMSVSPQINQYNKHWITELFNSVNVKLDVMCMNSQ